MYSLMHKSIYGMMMSILTVVWLLLCMVTYAYGTECTPPSYSGDWSYYPKKPLTFKDLDALIARGKRLVGVYDLQELRNPPMLQRIYLDWSQTSSTTFRNVGVGWWANPPPSVPNCQPFTIDFDWYDRRSKYVSLAFDVIWPAQRRFVGTMYSSCPERYIISWFCPEENLDLRKKFCSNDTRMSLLTFDESMDDIPWHLITGDLCTNKSPYLDDPRWKFMRFGDQAFCPFPTTRRKRSVDDVVDESAVEFEGNYRSLQNEGKFHFWP